MFSLTKSIIAVGGILLGTSVNVALADNPIIQTLYSTDPAPVVYNNTVYLFTGHDETGARNYDMRDWRLYSSTDMVNWRDHGMILSVKNFSWASKDAWAAQVIERDGKFYYYVTLTKNGGGYAIGVAVADKITGPYKDALGRQLLSNNGIDPTVWIDDDGQAYMYWGHNGPAYYVKLNRDMISYSGSIVGTQVQNFIEGPWLHKRNGLWYLTYAGSGASNEDIKYATSNSPTGPWQYRGQIMAPQGRSFTNHAGIIDYKNSSYLFYHNGALPGGGTYSRSVCVEKFTYNADGTIPKMTMTDAGAPQIGSLDPYQQVEAETIAFSSGLTTSAKSDGTGIYVTSISQGDYIKVKGVDFGTGASSVDLRVGAASSGGKIELRVGSQSGTVIATCNIDATGGAQTWKTVSCPVTGATGKQDLFFRFQGSNYNFDWWQFKKAASA
ncbi:glycosyl hydrolase [Podospora aff. communis PSN243]|uniref:Glycosyl hydrolase n=1 Tax=Podospora aff. communis PSN243 TaxID=3040156 RepID=A0AAV9GKC5_9PEZI|nr:glycosyl hydrolase [Podospora aff. communis PSN243]